LIDNGTDSYEIDILSLSPVYVLLKP
jgi:hypothetical protein